MDYSLIGHNIVELSPSQWDEMRFSWVRDIPARSTVHAKHCNIYLSLDLHGTRTKWTWKGKSSDLCVFHEWLENRIETSTQQQEDLSFLPAITKPADSRCTKLAVPVPLTYISLLAVWICPLSQRSTEKNNHIGEKIY